MKKIIQALEKCDFTIDYDYGNDRTLVKKRSNGLTFEFIVHYEREIKSNIGSTWDSPEEADLTFRPTKVTDLSIYNHVNEMFDFTDGQIETLIGIVESKLVK